MQSPPRRTAKDLLLHVVDESTIVYDQKGLGIKRFFTEFT
jgi:hypothetical protein